MGRRASSNSGAVGLTVVVPVVMELLQSVADLHCATVTVVLLRDGGQGLRCVARRASEASAPQFM